MRPEATPLNAESRIPDIRWAARLPHVREVSLLGSADLSYWNDRLLAEELTPAENGGRAQIMIVAAESKYMGLSFRELSISVLVARPGKEPTGNAAYLLQAFNSRWFFAFCERAFFSTPYDHGDVQVNTKQPIGLRLLQRQQIAFAAEMNSRVASPRETNSHREEGFEGPIFLPRSGHQNQANLSRNGKWFWAQLRGNTQRYPFVSSEDSLTICPSEGLPVLKSLRDSHFTATEWVIREDATHAKSKTYSRQALAEKMTGRASP